MSAQSTRSVAQQQRSAAKARYQTPAGTLAFVAPELFTRGVGNAESDVYSYSIILWQLKEMKVPYPAEQLPAIIQANVTTGKRPTLSEDASPPGLVELIMKCWDGDPGSRLSFQECMAMLENILRCVGSIHVAHTRRRQPDDQPPTRSRRLPASEAVNIAVSVCLCVFVCVCIGMCQCVHAIKQYRHIILKSS
jgi:serine/threonine protein kinase